MENNRQRIRADYVMPSDSFIFNPITPVKTPTAMISGASSPFYVSQKEIEENFKLDRQIRTGQAGLDFEGGMAYRFYKDARVDAETFGELGIKHQIKNASVKGWGEDNIFKQDAVRRFAKGQSGTYQWNPADESDPSNIDNYNSYWEAFGRGFVNPFTTTESEQEYEDILKRVETPDENWTEQIAMEKTDRFLIDNPGVAKILNAGGINLFDYTRPSRNEFGYEFATHTAVTDALQALRLQQWQKDNGWAGQTLDSLYYGIQDPLMVRDIAATTVATLGLGTLQTGALRLAGAAGQGSVTAARAMNVASAAAKALQFTSPTTGFVEGVAYKALQSTLSGVGRSPIKTIAARGLAIGAEAGLASGISAYKDQRDQYEWRNLIFNNNEVFKPDWSNVAMASAMGFTAGGAMLGVMRFGLGALTADMKYIRAKDWKGYWRNVTNSLDNWAETDKGFTVFGDTLSDGRGMFFGDMVDRYLGKFDDSRNFANVMLNGSRLYNRAVFNPAIAAKAAFDGATAAKIADDFAEVTGLPGEVIQRLPQNNPARVLFDNLMDPDFQKTSGIDAPTTAKLMSDLKSKKVGVAGPYGKAVAEVELENKVMLIKEVFNLEHARTLLNKSGIEMGVIESKIAKATGRAEPINFASATDRHNFMFMADVELNAKYLNQVSDVLRYAMPGHKDLPVGDGTAIPAAVMTDAVRKSFGLDDRTGRIFFNDSHDGRNPTFIMSIEPDGTMNRHAVTYKTDSNGRLSAEFEIAGAPDYKPENIRNVSDFKEGFRRVHENIKKVNEEAKAKADAAKKKMVREASKEAADLLERVGSKPTVKVLSQHFGLDSKEANALQIVMNVMGMDMADLVIGVARAKGKIGREMAAAKATASIEFVQLKSGIQALIRSTEHSDFGSMVHEMGHYNRIMFIGNTPESKTFRQSIGISDEMWEKFSDWVGYKGEWESDINKASKEQIRAEEKFANAWAFYIRNIMVGDGKTNATGMHRLFSAMGDHLGDLGNKFKTQVELEKGLVFSPIADEVYTKLFLRSQADLSKFWDMATKGVFKDLAPDQRALIGEAIMGTEAWNTYKAKKQKAALEAKAVAEPLIEKVAKVKSVPRSDVIASIRSKFSGEAYEPTTKAVHAALKAGMTSEQILTDIAEVRKQVQENTLPPSPNRPAAKPETNKARLAALSDEQLEAVKPGSVLPPPAVTWVFDEATKKFDASYHVATVTEKQIAGEKTRRANRRAAEKQLEEAKAKFESAKVEPTAEPKVEPTAEPKVEPTPTVKAPATNEEISKKLNQLFPADFWRSLGRNRWADLVDQGTATTNFKTVWDGLYDRLRLVEKEYKEPDSGAVANTGSTTPDMRSSNQDGWHYRIPTNYTSQRVNGKPINVTVERLSFNVTWSKELIQKLDDFFATRADKTTRRGLGYYKTPNESAGWSTRHDPITVYLTRKLTDEETREIVSIVSPNVRSGPTVNNLVGTKIADGIFSVADPTDDQFMELLNRLGNIDPRAKEQILSSLTSNPEKTIRGSAGNFEALRQLVTILESNRELFGLSIETKPKVEPTAEPKVEPTGDPELDALIEAVREERRTAMADRVDSYKLENDPELQALVDQLKIERQEAAAAEIAQAKEVIDRTEPPVEETREVEPEQAVESLQPSEVVVTQSGTPVHGLTRAEESVALSEQQVSDSITTVNEKLREILFGNDDLKTWQEHRKANWTDVEAFAYSEFDRGMRQYRHFFGRNIFDSEMSAFLLKIEELDEESVAFSRDAYGNKIANYIKQIEKEEYVPPLREGYVWSRDFANSISTVGGRYFRDFVLMGPLEDLKNALLKQEGFSKQEVKAKTIALLDVLKSETEPVFPNSALVGSKAEPKEMPTTVVIDRQPVEIDSQTLNEVTIQSENLGQVLAVTEQQLPESVIAQVNLYLPLAKFDRNTITQILSRIIETEKATVFDQDILRNYILNKIKFAESRELLNAFNLLTPEERISYADIPANIRSKMLDSTEVDLAANQPNLIPSIAREFGITEDQVKAFINYRAKYRQGVINYSIARDKKIMDKYRGSYLRNQQALEELDGTVTPKRQAELKKIIKQTQSEAGRYLEAERRIENLERTGSSIGTVDTVKVFTQTLEEINQNGRFSDLPAANLAVSQTSKADVLAKKFGTVTEDRSIKALNIADIFQDPVEARQLPDVRNPKVPLKIDDTIVNLNSVRMRAAVIVNDIVNNKSASIPNGVVAAAALLDDASALAAYRAMKPVILSEYPGLYNAVIAILLNRRSVLDAILDSKGKTESELFSALQVTASATIPSTPKYAKMNDVQLAYTLLNTNQRFIAKVQKIASRENVDAASVIVKFYRNKNGIIQVFRNALELPETASTEDVLRGIEVWVASTDSSRLTRLIRKTATQISLDSNKKTKTLSGSASAADDSDVFSKISGDERIIREEFIESEDLQDEANLVNKVQSLFFEFLGDTAPVGRNEIQLSQYWTARAANAGRAESYIEDMVKVLKEKMGITVTGEQIKYLDEKLNEQLKLFLGGVTDSNKKASILESKLGLSGRLFQAPVDEVKLDFVESVMLESLLTNSLKDKSVNAGSLLKLIKKEGPETYKDIIKAIEAADFKAIEDLYRLPVFLWEGSQDVAGTYFHTIEDEFIFLTPKAIDTEWSGSLTGVFIHEFIHAVTSRKLTENQLDFQRLEVSPEATRNVTIFVREYLEHVENSLNYLESFTPQDSVEYVRRLITTYTDELETYFENRPFFYDTETKVINSEQYNLIDLHEYLADSLFTKESGWDIGTLYSVLLGVKNLDLLLLSENRIRKHTGAKRLKRLFNLGMDKPADPTAPVYNKIRERFNIHANLSNDLRSANARLVKKISGKLYQGIALGDAVMEIETFRPWFGNSAAVERALIDYAGDTPDRPLELNHGSPLFGFDTFRVDFSKSRPDLLFGNGIYLTTSDAIAETYQEVRGAPAGFIHTTVDKFQQTTDQVEESFYRWVVDTYGETFDVDGLKEKLKNFDWLDYAILRDDPAFYNTREQEQIVEPIYHAIRNIASNSFPEIGKKDASRIKLKHLLTALEEQTGWMVADNQVLSVAMERLENTLGIPPSIDLKQKLKIILEGGSNSDKQDALGAIRNELKFGKKQQEVVLIQNAILKELSPILVGMELEDYWADPFAKPKVITQEEVTSLVNMVTRNIWTNPYDDVTAKEYSERILSSIASRFEVNLSSNVKAKIVGSIMSSFEIVDKVKTPTNLDILKALGFTRAENKKGTYKLFASIQKPIDADNHIVTREELEALLRVADNSYVNSRGNTLGNIIQAERRVIGGIEFVEFFAMVKQERLEHELIKAYMKLGYDGITHIGGLRVGRGRETHRVFIAWHPDQVKEITNKSFTKGVPNIRMQADYLKRSEVDALVDAADLRRRMLLQNGYSEETTPEHMEMISRLINGLSPNDVQPDAVSRRIIGDAQVNIIKASKAFDGKNYRRLDDGQRREFVNTVLLPKIREVMGDRNVSASLYSAVTDTAFGKKVNSLIGGAVNYADTADSGSIALQFLSKIFDPMMDLRDGELKNKFNLFSIDKLNAEVNGMLFRSGLVQFGNKLIKAVTDREQLVQINDLIWDYATRPNELPADIPHRDLILQGIVALNSYNKMTVGVLSEFGSLGKGVDPAQFGTMHVANQLAKENQKAFAEALTNWATAKAQKGNEISIITAAALGWLKIRRDGDTDEISAIKILPESPLGVLVEDKQMNKWLSWDGKTRKLFADRSVLNEETLAIHNRGLVSMQDYTDDWKSAYGGRGEYTAIRQAMEIARDRYLGIDLGDTKSGAPKRLAVGGGRNYDEQRIISHDELSRNPELSRFFNKDIMDLAHTNLRTRVTDAVMTKYISEFFGVRMSMEDLITVMSTLGEEIEGRAHLSLSEVNSRERGYDRVRQAWLNSLGRTQSSKDSMDKWYKRLLEDSRIPLTMASGLRAAVTSTGEVARAILASDKNRSILTQIIPNLVKLVRLIGRRNRQGKKQLLSATHWLRGLSTDHLLHRNGIHPENPFQGVVFGAGADGYFSSFVNSWRAAGLKNRTEELWLGKVMNRLSPVASLAGAPLSFVNDVTTTLHIWNAQENFTKNYGSFLKMAEILKKSPDDLQTFAKYAKECGLTPNEAVNLSSAGLLEPKYIKQIATLAQNQGLYTDGILDINKMYAYAGENEEMVEAITRMAAYVNMTVRNTNAEPTLLDIRVNQSLYGRTLGQYMQFMLSMGIQGIGRRRRNTSSGYSTHLLGLLMMEATAYGIARSLGDPDDDEVGGYDEFMANPLDYILRTATSLPVTGSYAFLGALLRHIVMKASDYFGGPSSEQEYRIPDLIQGPASTAPRRLLGNTPDTVQGWYSSGYDILQDMM